MRTLPREVDPLISERHLAPAALDSPATRARLVEAVAPLVRSLAHRVSGMVSVGENEALVKLT